MTVTPTSLTRASGLAAAGAGLVFAAVQIKHPHLDAAFVTTTEWTVREGAKIVMALLSLIGITGMYLHQVRRSGVLGLLGYALFALGYLVILSTQVIAVVVLPTIARTQPGYVDDVLTAATGGHPAGDIGAMVPFGMLSGIAYIGGGVLFGVALLRAGVLARWAAALLAVGTLAAAAIPLLPQVNERLFAVPTAVAMLGLGWSLWRSAAVPTDPQSSLEGDPTAAGTTRFDPAGAR